jgi:Legionella pneumophila major outer membrane protein precursor
MIVNMKTKISLILLGLGLASASAYAGAVDTTPMPVSNDINVTAPDQSGMWSFGATAVLLQPVSNNFTYNNTNTDNATNYQSVDQSYHWWFGADVSYAFPGNGRDVTLAYEGLHGSDSDSSVGTYNAGTLVAPVELPLGAEGKTDTSYDAGDLVFGQKLDVGQRIRLHPFVGLRYAHIDVKNTANYTELDANGNSAGVTTSGTQEGTFSGIGPRFGSDAQINLGQGFSIRGRLGLSALMGSSDPTLSYVTTDTTTNPTTVAPYSINQDSSTRVVPEMDGRLGLNYTYDFNSNMALGVEAGWQAVNYFNAVAQESIDGSIDHSNFALQGPYARLQLDVA